MFNLRNGPSSSLIANLISPLEAAGDIPISFDNTSPSLDII
ncbi:MAG: hypothetical protein ACFFD5_16225 [Candidatus Thorarchaeota archaeon]